MYGRVAQLVEQRTENPRAEGSSPPPTTTKFKGLSSDGLFSFPQAAFHIRERPLFFSAAPTDPDGTNARQSETRGFLLSRLVSRSFAASVFMLATFSPRIRMRLLSISRSKALRCVLPSSGLDFVVLSDSALFGMRHLTRSSCLAKRGVRTREGGAGRILASRCPWRHCVPFELGRRLG